VRRWLIFAVAVALYLPTVQYSFVQDDRVIVVGNPAVHSSAAAVRGFARPYWPPPNAGGLYRPLTILSYAADWRLAGGQPWLFHLMNALWHGLAAVLVVALVARWLPEPAAFAAGLVFALHPVHVEAVASIVGRAELLAAVGLLGAVATARRGGWPAAVACAAAAMLSKEHGAVAGILVLIDDWLRPPGARRYPVGLYVALGIVTAMFVIIWVKIGGAAAAAVAPPFLGAGPGGRLAVALPAMARAGWLLIWPAQLSADYGPQVIPVRTGISLAAVTGAAIAVAVVALGFGCRRRWPALSFAALAGALCSLPTSNLFFGSGVVLAERNLYVAVLLVAVAVGYAVAYGEGRWGSRRTTVAVMALALVLAAGSFARLRAWRDNRSFLLTLLVDHPESYHAHASAAAVLAGLRDTAGARREYARAESLFGGDPHLNAAHALYLVSLRDTTAAAALAARARALLPREHVALRAQFLIAWERGDTARALALADTARNWFPWDEPWYTKYLH
jgi:protein O-mannosyl-transferase